MAKAKSQASARATAAARAKKSDAAKPAARSSRAAAPQAMPRSMQKRGSNDSRQAVQQPKAGRATRGRNPDEAVTRVTHETEVRGTETRVERVVERAPKP